MWCQIESTHSESATTANFSKNSDKHMPVVVPQDKVCIELLEGSDDRRSWILNPEFMSGDLCYLFFTYCTCQLIKAQGNVYLHLDSGSKGDCRVST